MKLKNMYLGLSVLLVAVPFIILAGEDCGATTFSSLGLFVLTLVASILFCTLGLVDRINVDVPFLRPVIALGISAAGVTALMFGAYMIGFQRCWQF